tara:strand:- start:86 stop:910 length:825 start_codon:yes stop_codon:yes gene_type:complete
MSFLKDIIKFFLFLFSAAINKKKRYIIISPNLTYISINKIYLYNKNKKNFICVFIRNKYDYITLIEIYYNQNYDIKSDNFYKIIKKDFENINKKLLIVDCGSNIGCSTNFFIDTYEDSKVISIEPDIENYKILEKNVLSEKAVKINSAVSSEVYNYETVNNFNKNYDPRGIEISKKNDQNLPKTKTINQILSNQDNIDLYPFIIKIDIEGYEKILFEKNLEWVDEFKIIIIELHDWCKPNENISNNYIKAIANSLKNYNRDLIIKGENLLSIKY